MIHTILGKSNQEWRIYLMDVVISLKSDTSIKRRKDKSLEEEHLKHMRV